MSLSNYAEGALLDHLFSKAAYTQPTLYLAVSTANPTEDGSGLTEPVGNGYARVATTGTDWTRTGSQIDNANDLSFPEATGSWGNLTYFALFDAPTGGNMIAFAPLSVGKAVSASEVLRFPAGNITMTLD